MSDDAELIAAVDGRPFWHLDPRGAVFSPPDATAYVRVHPVRVLSRTHERYIASVVMGWAAVQSILAPSAAAAVAWAEQRDIHPR